MKYLVFIIYDSIKNSAFAGQVLKPILKRINENPDQKIYLISFEKEQFSHEQVSRYIPKINNLIFIQLKRFRFLGKLSLYYSVFQLKKQLNKFNSNYSVICRGALAAWVCTKSMNHKNLCTSFIVQARGLLPEEYEYAHKKNSNFLVNLISRWLVKEFTKIEQEAYVPKYEFKDFKIESVTTALEEHLIKKYKVNKNDIIIASYDIPDNISRDKLVAWKQEIRKELNITLTAEVFCYNGSVKAWQGADLVVDFFKKKLIKNKNVFLLILTQEKEEFENLLVGSNIDKNYYKVTFVDHSEIYKFLAACDIGLIFRQPGIISWVSRPIKAMEYKSIGLKIIHNNTVKWLIDQT